MPYLGNLPAERYSSADYQDLTGGTGTSFTLDHPVGNAQEVLVVVNNVVQEPGVAYTVSGTGLTMTGSIASTDDFYVVFRGKAVLTATFPSDRALTATDGTFTGDLTVDTNTLHVDAANDAVGVGTTSPNNNLEVSGSGTVARITSDNANVYLRLKNSSNDGGYLGYESSAISLWSGSSKRITVDSDGLKFGSDTAAANALDDYETGSVTLSYQGGNSNPTVSYAIQSAEYVKIGDFVFIAGRLRTNTVTVGSGTLRIGGLPFTVATGQIWGVVKLGYISGWPADNFPSTGYAEPGTTRCDLIKYNSDDPRDERAAAVDAASMTTSSAGNDIIFNITYKTS